MQVTNPSDASGTDPVSIDAEPGVLRTLPLLQRTGLYTVTGALPPMNRIAVSMLSDRESNIRPVDTLVVNARRIDAGRPQDATARELWPWLVAVAGLLLMAEWGLYCWKMRG